MKTLFFICLFLAFLLAIVFYIYMRDDAKRKGGDVTPLAVGCMTPMVFIQFFVPILIVIGLLVKCCS